MGSKRVAGLLAVLALLAPAAATAASAATPEEARPVAEQFIRAFVTEDAATVCSLLSARLLAKFESADACVQTVFRPFEIDFNRAADREAHARLELAYEAAQVAALDAPTGRFPSPAKKLSLAVRSLLPLTRIVIGKGPVVVRDTDTRVIGINGVRSTATRVVFYAESDSGLIFRLSGGLRGKPTISAVAQGVPDLPEVTGAGPIPPFELTSRVLPDGAEAALVLVTLTIQGEGVFDVPVRLIVEGGAWKVDALYTDILSDLVGFVSASS